MRLGHLSDLQAQLDDMGRSVGALNRVSRAVGGIDGDNEDPLGILAAANQDLTPPFDISPLSPPVSWPPPTSTLPKAVPLEHVGAEADAQEGTQLEGSCFAPESPAGDLLLERLLKGLENKEMSVGDALGALESKLQRADAAGRAESGSSAADSRRDMDSMAGRWAPETLQDISGGMDGPTSGRQPSAAAGSASQRASEQCAALSLQVKALAQSLAGIGARAFQWASALSVPLQRELASLVLEYTRPCAHIEASLQDLCEELECVKWPEVAGVLYSPLGKPPAKVAEITPLQEIAPPAAHQLAPSVSRAKQPTEIQSLQEAAPPAPLGKQCSTSKPSMAGAGGASSSSYSSGQGGGGGGGGAGGTGRAAAMDGRATTMPPLSRHSASVDRDIAFHSKERDMFLPLSRGALPRERQPVVHQHGAQQQWQQQQQPAIVAKSSSAPVTTQHHRSSAKFLFNDPALENFLAVASGGREDLEGEAEEDEEGEDEEQEDDDESDGGMGYHGPQGGFGELGTTPDVDLNPLASPSVPGMPIGIRRLQEYSPPQAVCCDDTLGQQSHRWPIHQALNF